MTKKIPAFLCAVLLLMSLAVPASAAGAKEEIIDLGDGYYVIRTIETYAMTRSGDTVSGRVTDRLMDGATQIGSATLYATFDISGSSAVATDAFLTGSATSGWTYTNGGTYCSGSRATGTAIFSSNSVIEQLPLSLSCTPDGELY